MYYTAIARRAVLLGTAQTIFASNQASSQTPRLRLGPRRTVHYNAGALHDPLQPPADVGCTYGIALRLEDMPYALRVGFANDVALDFPVTAVAGCISTAYNDGVRPTGGAPWALLTTNLGGRDVGVDAAASGSARGLLVRGNGGGPRVPNIAWTDWTAIQAVPPDDGTGRPILFLRASFAPWIAPRCCNVVTQFSGTPHSHGRDMIFTYSLGHDSATAPNQATPPFGTGQASPFYCVQYLSHRRGSTVLWGGDSHFAGNTTIGNIDAFPLKTCLELSTPDHPICAANYAWSGSPSDVFFPILQEMVAQCRPNIVILQGWTANDGPTAAAINSYSEHIMEYTRKLAQSGIEPILVTRFPRFNLALHPDQLALTELWRQRQLGMRSAGFLVLDAPPVLDDPSSPGAYRTGYSKDKVHPNEAGSAALASALKPVLNNLLRHAA